MAASGTPTPSAAAHLASAPAPAPATRGSSNTIWYVVGVLVLLLVVGVVIFLVVGGGSGGGTGTGTGTRTATSTTGTGTATGTVPYFTDTSLKTDAGLFVVSGASGTTPTLEMCGTQDWQIEGQLNPTTNVMTGTTIYNVTRGLFLSASADGTAVTMTPTAGATGVFSVTLSSNSPAVGIRMGSVKTSAERYITTAGSQGSPLAQTSALTSATTFILLSGFCPTPDFTIATETGELLLTAPTTEQGSAPFLSAAALGAGLAAAQQRWKFIVPETGSGTGTSAAGTIFLHNQVTGRYLTVGDPAGGNVAVMSFKNKATESMIWESFIRAPTGTGSLERLQTFHGKYLQRVGTSTSVDGDGSETSNASVFQVTQVGTSQ